MSLKKRDLFSQLIEGALAPVPEPFFAMCEMDTLDLSAKINADPDPDRVVDYGNLNFYQRCTVGALFLKHAVNHAGNPETSKGSVLFDRLVTLQGDLIHAFFVPEMEAVIATVKIAEGKKRAKKARAALTMDLHNMVIGLCLDEARNRFETLALERRNTDFLAGMTEMAYGALQLCKKLYGGAYVQPNGTSIFDAVNDNDEAYEAVLVAAQEKATEFMEQLCKNHHFCRHD